VRPEAETLLSLGNVYQTTGRHAKALRAYEASLQAARALGARSLEAGALLNLGCLRLVTGKPTEARRAFAEARKAAEEAGAVQLTAYGHWGLGLVHQADHRWGQAAAAYRQAIRDIEQLRAQTGEPSLQTSLFARYTSPYHALSRCLLEFGRSADAFAVSEQAKARTLADLLRAGRGHELRYMTAVECRREQELNEAVTALAAQLQAAHSRVGADAEELDPLTQRLREARAAYEAFRRQLYLAHPELETEHAAFAPATLTEINRALFAAEPDLAVLAYSVGQDEVVLFVLTRGPGPRAAAVLTVHRVAVDFQELRDEIRDFRLSYERPGARLDADSARLYGWLLAPAADQLSGKAHVVIIPDGVLHTLPFAALRDTDGAYLIDKHAVSYAPSVTALLHMMALADHRRRVAGPAPDPTLLAVGRPAFGPGLKDLPATETEACRIAGLFGKQSRLLVGPAARKAAVVAGMGRARYVHFATHGLINEAAPLYSALALSQEGERDDGLLSARDLLDMDLRADMVVLSACRTAQGQQVHGEGVLGLTWALLVAGSPCNVVTQWSVADESTSALMVDYYRLLAAGAGRRPAGRAEALREAQRRLLKDGRHKHPYYWAPFVLVGDWRHAR
jgi:CHAT domain-containing protein